ncbi:MAG: ferrous iron transport protein B [Candidatus Aminicenantaceae bacterium]
MTKNKECPDVVFVGQPNCGKSTLFNFLAGLRAETSDLPGTTVKHSHSKVNVQGEILNIIDLPGTYTLNPSDDAEKVALTHLFQEIPDLIINVMDASIMGRSLEMTLELLELEYPMIVALNMMDLADKKGMDIDVAKLEERLGIPVIPIIASHGRGIKELLDAVQNALRDWKTPARIPWARDVEERISEVEAALPEDFHVVANPRFSALKALEIEKQSFHRMLEELSPRFKQTVDRVRAELETRHNAPAYEVIASERHHLALKLFEETCTVTRGTRLSWTERVDAVIMHPVFGYVILLLVFLGFFFVIFKVATPIEELFLKPLDSLRASLPSRLGDGLFFYLVDGLLQGVGGGIAIVLPYFLPLLFMMAFLEDISYIARAGFLMDTFMHKIGLHGKSVSAFILGFGCNVPAIVSTRVLESRRDRVITSLLIPFIPCSARTMIILALVGFYLGPLWALGFYVFNMFVLGVLGRLMSWIYKSPSPGLILEIPALKAPSLPNILRRTFFQFRYFVQFAWPILIIGSMVLAVLQFLKFDLIVNLVLSPIVQGVLGLPKDLGVTLVFGFLRKELSLIMMLQALGVSYQDLMTILTREQLVVFVVFINFFVPCLSTVAILWKEIGRKEAMISMALNTSVALLIAFLVRLFLRF